MPVKFECINPKAEKVLNASDLQDGMAVVYRNKANPGEWKDSWGERVYIVNQYPRVLAFSLDGCNVVLMEGSSTLEFKEVDLTISIHG